MADAGSLIPQAASAQDLLLPLRIGLIAPLSGSSADFGNSMALRRRTGRQRDQ